MSFQLQKWSDSSVKNQAKNTKLKNIEPKMASVKFKKLSFISFSFKVVRASDSLLVSVWIRIRFRFSLSSVLDSNPIQFGFSLEIP